MESILAFVCVCDWVRKECARENLCVCVYAFECLGLKKHISLTHYHFLFEMQTSTSRQTFAEFFLLDYHIYVRSNIFYLSQYHCLSFLNPHKPCKGLSRCVNLSWGLFFSFLFIFCNLFPETPTVTFSSLWNNLVESVTCIYFLFYCNRT